MTLFHWPLAHHLTFRKVFSQGLHVVGSVLSGGVGAQVSTHRLHLLLQGHLSVLLGALGRHQEGR